MSAYRSLEDLEGAFADFVRAVPFYGLAVLCIDDAKVRSLAQQYNGRKVNYGFSSDADLSARDLKHHRQSSQFSLFQRGQRLGEVTLSMPGRHMVLNSLAAIGVALEFGITLPVIQQALSAFQGVDRRLEVIGEAAGVRVMNDYGHHPAEIRATLRAVRDGWGAETKRVIGVFQPHRYTRTRDCFAEFTQAFDDVDVLHVMDIYSAGEPPIDGISGENLCEAIVHQNKRFAGSSGDLLELCLSEVREGDMVVFLGAGSVGALSHQYLATLRELERASVGSDGANRSGSAQS
jgi:UDP-N-acetylmuramate--alanine ligase